MAKKLKYPAEVLQPVKSHLTSKLSGLERQKKDLVKSDPFEDKNRVLDNAAVDADAAEQVGHMEASVLKRSVERSIIQVRKALARIKLGRYGVCEKCGQMIDTDRLMVMPEITICLSCEKRREK